jgi:hypothetical protein
MAAIGAIVLASTGGGVAVGAGVAGAAPPFEPRIVGSSDSTTGPALTEPGTYQMNLRLVVEITNGNEFPVNFSCDLTIGGVVHWHDAGQLGARRGRSMPISIERFVSEENVPAVPTFACELGTHEAFLFFRDVAWSVVRLPI